MGNRSISPVNMPDPIHIRSGLARKHWAEQPDDSRTLACFQTRSIWSKPYVVNQNQIGSGLVLYNLIRAICGRMQPSLKVGNWQWACCILPELGPDDSCTPACFRTRHVWPKPGPAIQTGYGPVLHSMIQAFFGRTELNWIQEGGFWLHAGFVMATIGRNQNASRSDPACLLGICTTKRLCAEQVNTDLKNNTHITYCPLDRS